MKIGDKINCITTQGSQSLEYDRDYIVHDINEYDNIQVRQATAPYATLPHYYKPTRFKFLERVPAWVNKKDGGAIDFSKTYTTRSGKKVNLLARSKDPQYPFMGEVLNGSVWTSQTWTADGSFYIEGPQCDDDLVEVVDSKEVVCDQAHVTIYRDGSVYMGIKNGSVAFEMTEMAAIVSTWNYLQGLK